MLGKQSPGRGPNGTPPYMTAIADNASHQSFLDCSDSIHSHRNAASIIAKMPAGGVKTASTPPVG